MTPEVLIKYIKTQVELRLIIPPDLGADLLRYIATLEQENARQVSFADARVQAIMALLTKARQLLGLSRAYMEHEGRESGEGISEEHWATYEEIKTFLATEQDTPTLCRHVWTGQQVGGPPDMAESAEWVAFCKECGAEKGEEG